VSGAIGVLPYVLPVRSARYAVVIASRAPSGSSKLLLAVAQPAVGGGADRFRRASLG